MIKKSTFCQLQLAETMGPEKTRNINLFEKTIIEFAFNHFKICKNSFISNKTLIV